MPGFALRNPYTIIVGGLVTASLRVAAFLCMRIDPGFLFSKLVPTGKSARKALEKPW